MKLIQVLKISIVLLALVAPGLIFVLTGPVTGFERKIQTDFPHPNSILLPELQYREQLADAIFERSAAKRWAIRFMNALYIHVFDFIETDTAISGSDQWIFYKPQLQAWDCNHHEVLQTKLDRFSFLVDLVSAAEIPLIFAHAPNKASVERDHLGGRAARYTDCYFRFEQRFTDVVSDINPSHFVDHSKVLNHAPGEQPTYLKFDTHWTWESGLKAMNQLFESRPGVLGIPLYQPEIKNEAVSMDILNAMLLQEQVEFIPVPVSVKPGIEELQSARLAPNVLFIHDSFYRRILQYFIDRSPNARFQLPRPGSGVDVRENLDWADIVVVEMVQRDFLDFVWSGSYLGWGSIFAEWLLEEITTSAQQCVWEEAKDLLAGLPDQRASMKNLVTTGKKLRMAGSGKSQVLFHLPSDLVPGKVCLRVQLEVAGPGKARLYFSAPEATAQQPGYSNALMVSKNLSSGKNTLALILPENFRGKWIRLDPIDHEGELTIHALDVTTFKQATIPILSSH